MGIGVGMRGKDLRSFLKVAREKNVIILVRHTNAESLKYVGKDGYYPKPAVCKAKTADTNPPPRAIAWKGKKITRQYEVAGLVVHPDFHPDVYSGGKVQKALDAWHHTLEVMAPVCLHFKADRERPDSWSTWGQERRGVRDSARWKWRIDIDPESPHFGCLQLCADGGKWCYIHGDYDLKDVIVRGRETENRAVKLMLDGVPNMIPILHGRDFARVKELLNLEIGAEMVQHGSEAQFAWHGEEPITVAYPDGNFKLLYDAVTVQSWYMDLKREVLAKGKDHQKDPKNIIHLGWSGPK